MSSELVRPIPAAAIGCNKYPAYANKKTRLTKKTFAPSPQIDDKKNVVSVIYPHVNECDTLPCASKRSHYGPAVRTDTDMLVISPNPLYLFISPWFLASLAGWMSAQLIKMAIAFFRTRRLNLHYLVSTGGMPSAHSALVCSLATSIGMTEGFDKPITVMAVVFASITMFDAAVVRRAAGQQARILNRIIDELFQQHRLSERHLKELLGHTRMEVFMGMLLGIAVGVVTVCHLHL
jgi:hypothetical protein